MKTLVIAIAMLVGCAQPDVGGPDAGTGEVAQADTVCGLPDTCNPESCYTVTDADGTVGLQCYENTFGGDLGCQIACGSSFARCSADSSQVLDSCTNHCSSVNGTSSWAPCVADCVNNSHYTCVYGLAP